MRSALDTLYTATRASAVLVSILLASLAHAQPAADPRPTPRDELDLWVPALGIFSGVLGQEASAGVSACCLAEELITTDPNGNPIFRALTIAQTPDPIVPPAVFNPLRPVQSGNDLLVTPFVGGHLELMTPGIRNLPGSPRFFASVGMSAAFSLEKDIARESEVGEMIDPMKPRSPDVAVLGQGSITRVSVEPYVIHAGVGMAFTIDAWDRRFRIKPTLGYMQDSIRVQGVVHRAQQLHPGVIPPIGPFTTTFRFIELEGEETRTFHGIGPGLELEMDTGRAGPFILSLFLSGTAYRWLGDRSISVSPGELTTTFVGDGLDFPPPLDVFNVDPDSYAQDQTATWTFKRHRWGYRGGVGIRFRWAPE